MIDSIGYLALIIALAAMMSKKIVILRWLHLISCGFYAVYGSITAANPVIIGAILFGGIHVYHLYKIKNLKNR